MSIGTIGRAPGPAAPCTSMRASRVHETVPQPYRLSFLVGGLFAEESRVAAGLHGKSGDWAAVRRALDEGNLLHARTRATAVRLARELIQRMATLNDEETAHVATAPGPDHRHLMWAAFCRRYSFVGEFAQEVLRDGSLFGASVRAGDFERFWAAKALWHHELDAVKPSTRGRLRVSLFLAMRQAELLDDDGRVLSPLLSREVASLLRARTPSDLRFFPVGGPA